MLFKHKPKPYSAPFSFGKSTYAPSHRRPYFFVRHKYLINPERQQDACGSPFYLPNGIYICSGVGWHFSQLTLKCVNLY